MDSSPKVWIVVLTYDVGMSECPRVSDHLSKMGILLLKSENTGIPRNSRLIRRKRPSRISKYREFRNLYNLGKEVLNFVVFGHFLIKW